MKKKFKLENLDCAHCGEKIQEGIKKIPGVQDAKVNFLMGKLTIESEEDDFTEILKAADLVCKKIDSNCKIIG